MIVHYGILAISPPLNTKQMENTLKMTLSEAIAALELAWLRSRNLDTHDFRSFEFIQNGATFTKVDNLLRAVKFIDLTEEEREANAILSVSGCKAVQNDQKYILRLFRDI